MLYPRRCWCPLVCTHPPLTTHREGEAMAITKIIVILGGIILEVPHRTAATAAINGMLMAEVVVVVAGYCQRLPKVAGTVN